MKPHPINIREYIATFSDVALRDLLADIERFDDGRFPAGSVHLATFEALVNMLSSQSTLGPFSVQSAILEAAPAEAARRWARDYDQQIRARLRERDQQLRVQMRVASKAQKARNKRTTNAPSPRRRRGSQPKRTL